MTIEITGVNDAPDAVDDLGTGFGTEFETAFTTASVLSNDTDPDTSDTLTISEVDSSSLSGTLVDNGDGTFFVYSGSRFSRRGIFQLYHH